MAAVVKTFEIQDQVMLTQAHIAFGNLSMILLQTDFMLHYREKKPAAWITRAADVGEIPWSTNASRPGNPDDACWYA